MLDNNEGWRKMYGSVYVLSLGVLNSTLEEIAVEFMFSYSIRKGDWKGWTYFWGYKKSSELCEK